MIVRVSWLGLLGMAVALAQPPAGPGGRRMGPPGGAFQGGRFLGAEAGMRARVVTNAPFSADIVTETTQTLADGNHINQTATVHFSRDSQGRTRREQSLNNLGTLRSNRTVVFINDPVAGASYALMPDSKTATRSVRPARGGPGGRGTRGQTATNGDGTAVLPRGAGRGGRGGWNNQNVKTETLGTQMIDGVQAQGTRTTLTIPAGQVGNEQPLQVVTERWYSPELQVALMVKRTDPRGGQTVTQYTNISRAEPVPTQFQVPSDYTVKTAGRGAGAQQ